MPSIMQGDYSSYPSPVKEIFPYCYGEVCRLHVQWQVYRRLFMASKARTELLGQHLGGVLSQYQWLLADDMVMTIGRLTDSDSKSQKNLGLPALCGACAGWDHTLGAQMAAKLSALNVHLKPLRQHRHKRLAHYDLPTSLGTVALPALTLKHIREAIEQMEEMIQMVATRGQKTTIMFEVLDHRDTTNAADIAVAKAAYYDAMVAEDKIPRYAWRAYIVKD